MAGGGSGRCGPAGNAAVTLVIGTDEAGYGPNLGPLVVGATAWRVAAEPEAVEEALQAALAPLPALWGDSKQIYRGGAGFPALERGVLVAVGLAGGAAGGDPPGWESLAARLGAAADPEPPEAACLRELPLPRHRHKPACAGMAAEIAPRLAAAGVWLEAVRCRLVQPAEFNAVLASGLNKSDLLSLVTLDLAAALARDLAGGEPVLVWCDRHGGRRRYAPQVGRAFGLPLVRPLEETASRSAYALEPAGRIEFCVGGEARLPVAVASMTAKYVRELAMLAFNAHWSEQQPGLAPTAGYPVDAARWRREAAAAVARAGVGWDALWRQA